MLTEPDDQKAAALFQKQHGRSIRAPVERIGNWRGLIVTNPFGAKAMPNDAYQDAEATMISAWSDVLPAPQLLLAAMRSKLAIRP